MNVLTTIIAVIGAVLGIMNTWAGMNQRRVKLKVVPQMAHFISGTGDWGPEMGCIEVTNLSVFPVTVREVGFTIDRDLRKGKRVAITPPRIIDGGPWPRRPEARTTVSLYFDWVGLGGDIKRAYVLTECGEVAYGDSPALESIRSRIKNASFRS